MNVVSFTISEGDDFDYESFNKDYCNPYISKKELQEKYNLSDGMYYNRSKYATECTGFRRKAGRQSNRSMRNIYKRKNHYEIRKGGGRYTRYCGTYKDLKTAYMVRDLLDHCNWTSDIIKDCIKNFGVKRNTRGSNQYNSPLTFKALDKYPEFERMFLSGEYSYQRILDELGFTRHQYNVCHRELKKKYGNIRKKTVRN